MIAAGRNTKDGKLHDSKMKGLLRIFELSKNEQRVVLIATLVLIAIAFMRYERRVHRSPVQSIAEVEAKPSPTPVQTQNER
jgi:hypothetical protein